MVLSLALIACHSNKKKSAEHPVENSEEDVRDAMLEELFEDDLEDLPEAGDTSDEIY